jgi:hypothetical protein
MRYKNKKARNFTMATLYIMIIAIMKFHYFFISNNKNNLLFNLSSKVSVF